MTDREIMQQALAFAEMARDYLTEASNQYLATYGEKWRPMRLQSIRDDLSVCDAVITALRARLAQPEQPMKAATTATEAIKLFPEVAYWYREFLEHNTVGGIEALKSSEDQLADPYSTKARVAIAALREQLMQPEQSPLDRMAENARELGLDYEPVQGPEQEPVAWQYSFTHSSAIGHGDYDIGPLVTDKKDVAFGVGCFGQLPLYTTPPRREWVGLTEEGVRDLWSWSMTAEAERTANTQQHAFARAIEAKLKAKNDY